VLLGVVWTGFWFYAAHRADLEIARWRAQEAQNGRIFECGRQQIGGYPFRIEVNCADPSIELQKSQPPLAGAAKNALFTVQVYDPTLVIGEFAGPLSIGEPSRPPDATAKWTLAQASLRGRPLAPERLSIVLDNAEITQSGAGATTNNVAAEHVELHGQVVGGSAAADPVVELGLRLTNGTASTQALAQPTSGVMSATLHGLRNLSPKPWREELRELAQANGRLEIEQAKFTQGEIAAVGSGTLTIKPNGRIDGQIKLTVAGLERLIGLLGIDQAVTQYLAQRSGGMTVDKLASGLDRLMPGLGGAVRGQSGANLAAAGISMLGEPTQLDGRRAVALPLRFVDSAILLGPIAIGQVPQVF
jgi:hypothetical protein